MTYNNYFRFDLKIGQINEQQLAEIFADKKIEVKFDRKYKSGNVFIEYECNGMPSGIATTESEYYCFVLGHTFHLISTDDLKERARPYLKKRSVLGGDNNKCKGILLPLTELF
jgi:hypothetical protein